MCIYVQIYIYIYVYTYIYTVYIYIYLPKLLYFLPRLPRVLFRFSGLMPRIANSLFGNKVCPRYFSKKN